jgi:hypothetical protein
LFWTGPSAQMLRKFIVEHNPISQVHHCASFLNRIVTCQSVTSEIGIMDLVQHWRQYILLLYRRVMYIILCHYNFVSPFTNLSIGAPASTKFPLTFTVTEIELYQTKIDFDQVRSIFNLNFSHFIHKSNLTNQYYWIESHLLSSLSAPPTRPEHWLSLGWISPNR